MQSPLAQRIHISPEALARSPGRLARRFDTVIDALNMTGALLRPLPNALAKRWLAEPRGHIIIDAQKHRFVAGENQFRGRTFQGAAWVRLALLVDDPADYLSPVGWLISGIIGWGRANARNALRQIRIHMAAGCFAASVTRGKA